MSLEVRVEGGTRAGCKRALKPKAVEWKCACGERHPGYMVRCPAGSERRPA